MALSGFVQYLAWDSALGTKTIWLCICQHQNLTSHQFVIWCHKVVDCCIFFAVQSFFVHSYIFQLLCIFLLPTKNNFYIVKKFKWSLCWSFLKHLLLIASLQPQRCSPTANWCGTKKIRHKPVYYNNSDVTLYVLACKSFTYRKNKNFHDLWKNIYKM